MVNKSPRTVEGATFADRVWEKLTVNGLTVRGLHREVEALARKHGVAAPKFATLHSYTYRRPNSASEKSPGTVSPPAAAAALMAEALRVPLTWLVFGEGSDAAPPTYNEILASVAPDAVPLALRRKFGALMTGYVLDLGLAGGAETRPAVFRILTAMMAQVQKERGERPSSPVALLEQLRGWKGDDALLDYLWNSINAAAILEHIGRQRTPKATKAKTKPTKSKGRN